MTENIKCCGDIRLNLINHYDRFPLLQAEDIFKYIFQSSFGCEHLVSDENSALEYIKSEYSKISKDDTPFKESLDGEYSRVYLSWLNSGLSPETLTKLFCLSAKNESDGKVLLQEKIQAARKLISSGEIPIDYEDFERKLKEWQGRGCPPVHHSDIFRNAYKPAYRVISDRYADFIQVFSEIDRCMKEGSVIIAIEGGSASGKSTLSEALNAVYDCNVFHTDDFFLRPEQRTPERFSEIGGNLDRERFADEVLRSLKNNEPVQYRPFDCSIQALGNPRTVMPKKLTVVEGVYSMHPAFGKYYNLSVFLDIDAVYQKKRITVRNSPTLAKRFFDEWIPLENTYFAKTDIKKRVDRIISINDKNR